MRLSFGAAGALVLFLATQPLAGAKAQDGNAAMPWKHAAISIGGFWPIFDSDLRLDSETLGRGTTFDLEEALGLDKSGPRLRLGAFWRIAPRHMVDFEYYNMSREGLRIIDEQLQIGDSVFPINTQVASDIKFKVYRLSYGYSFWQDSKVDIAGQIGFFVGDLGLNFTAPAVSTENRSLFAPLPVLGLRGAYAFTPKLIGQAGAQFFFLTPGDDEGFLFDFKTTLEYEVHKNIMLGLGYNFTRIDVDLNNDSNTTSLFYQWGGVLAYLKFFL